MTRKLTSVLLATYTNESGDRMEFVLPKMSDAEVDLVQAFLDHEYPSGGAVVSVVGIEPFTAFTSSFAGDFEEFLAGAWKR